MGVLDILRGNYPGSGLLKEFGINAGIVAVACLVVFAGGRAIGLIDFVGYQWRTETSNSLINRKREPISIVSPVYLKAGESVTARYDAEISAGKITFHLRKGLVPLANLSSKIDRRVVTQSGESELTFTVSETGFYWPASYIRADYAGQSNECRTKHKSKNMLELMVMPEGNCASRVANYTVVWFTS